MVHLRAGCCTENAGHVCVQGDVGDSKEDPRAVLALAASPTESTVAAIFER